AVSFFAARVRVLAAFGFLLAAIHRAGFATAFLIATGRTSVIILGRTHRQRCRRNRQTAAANNCDDQGFHSSHWTLSSLNDRRERLRPLLGGKSSAIIPECRVKLNRNQPNQFFRFPQAPLAASPIRLVAQTRGSFHPWTGVFSTVKWL